MKLKYLVQVIIAASLFQSHHTYADSFPSSFELKEWQDSETSTTAQFSESCGILTEARLMGSDLSNFFFLGLKNTSQKTLFLRLDQATIKMSNGIERSPELPANQEVIKLSEGLSYAGYLPSPSKTDFKDADWVDLQIPVFAENQEPTNCNIQVRLQRDTSRPQPVTSISAYTKFEFDLGIGSTLYRGNLSNIGGRTAGGEIAADFYPGLHNGFFVDIYFDGYTSPHYELLGSNVDTSKNILGVSFFTGYSRRDYLAEKWELSWRAGVGAYILDSFKQDQSDNSSGYFGTLGQVALDYRYSKVDFGPWRGIYSVGVAFQDIWIPGGTTNSGASVAGQNGAWLLRWRAGF